MLESVGVLLDIRLPGLKDVHAVSDTYAGIWGFAAKPRLVPLSS